MRQPWRYKDLMMQHLYEHPSGVFLNVTYVPATAESVKQIQSVHVTDTTYQSVGPDIAPMLHDTHLLDMSGPVTLATPLLELISEDITNG
jgi:hypothetical protein